jgi:23S rRNA (guanine745-N1)-methyltransferase
MSPRAAFLFFVSLFVAVVLAMSCSFGSCIARRLDEQRVRAHSSAPSPRAHERAKIRPEMLEGRVELVCSVRGCNATLCASGRAAGKDLVCARGHTFNVARSGYVNLLQPQERRSKEPGDSKAVVAARRRLLDAGRSRPLIEALCAMIGELGLPRGAPVLDLGCGEGTMLAAIEQRFELEAWGIDISTPAIDAAAKRWPRCRWIVANADRTLPFRDGSMALVLSVTGRRNHEEHARVLATDGRALFVLPAEDDQRELRAAVLGRATSEDRMEKLAREIGSRFRLVSRRDVRWRERYDAASLRDLLATTYRGARHSERERVEVLDALDVTSSYALALFRRT